MSDLFEEERELINDEPILENVDKEVCNARKRLENLLEEKRLYKELSDDFML